MESCAACGAENRPGRKFCASCGASLALPVVCATCGTTNEPDERFCGECGTALPGTDSEEATPSAAPHQGRESERRIVSVLFADLVGSTAVAEGRDPEETRELLTRYFATCREIVDRYGGTLEKFIGDAVMAVWGAPIAHEDDAERATRAALDLVDAVGRLEVRTDGEKLRQRAAVMTGEAAVTLGAQGEGMVAGDLVNTAARLQGVAEPGTVLVGEATQEAASAAITFEAAAPQQLKGKELPVAAWRANRIVAGRGGSLRDASAEPPFCGRDGEFALLKDLYHATSREGRLRCVSITGQAGIGKSRLAWELEKYLDGVAETVLWHQGRSPAYGEGVTFWALGEMVRRRAGIAESDDEAETRGKLREAIEENVPDEGERRWVEPKLLALLGLGPADTADSSELFAAWRLFFERLAGQATTVLVFEDLHWADSGLIDFIEHLMEWSRQKPILIVTLARPELLLERRPTWGASQRNFTNIHLEPIDASAIREMLSGFVPGLPASAVNAIIQRAEGVPLYAVETVRMMLAQGLVEAEGDRYRLVRPLSGLAIPDTLHALIAARLDALPPGLREAIQDASVLGQSFSTGALEAVTGRTADELRPSLEALGQAELLRLESDPRSPERGQYQLLQGVVREVAYGTLARRDRRTRHLAAARYYESQGDDELTPVLASHYVDAYRASPEGEEADALAAQARVALRAAADRAAGLNSPAQALALLEQALLVTRDGADQAITRERAGEAAINAGSYGRAREHFDAVAAWHRSVGSQLDDARLQARIAFVEIYEGNIGGAISRLEPVIAALGDAADGPVGVHVFGQLGRALFLEQAAGPALEAIDRAIASGERSEELAPLVDAIVTKGSILSLQRPREGRAVLTGAIALADAYGLHEAAFRGRNNLSFYLAYDDPAEVTRVIADALRAAERTGNRAGLSNFTAGLAWSQFLLGDWDQALKTIEPLDEVDLPPPLAFGVRWLRGGIAAGRGETELLARLREEREELVSGMDSSQYAAGNQIGLAWENLVMDRPEEALRHGQAAAEGDDEYGAWLIACRAAIMSRDRAAAERTIAKLFDLPPRGRAVDAAAAEMRAGLAALQGREADSLAEYADAFPRWRDLDSPFNLTLAQLSCVIVLGAEAAEVRAAAAEARAFLERVGARPLLDFLDRSIVEPRPTSSGRTSIRSEKAGLPTAPRR